MAAMEATLGTKDEQYEKLCQRIQELVPEELGNETWYLIIATVLTVSPQPELLGSFHIYLTSHDPSFSTLESRERLSLRLRDTLLKLVTLVGAPQVLSALIPLAKAEGEPATKAERSKLSEKWKDITPSSIHARGAGTIDSIYGSTLLPKIFSSFGAHTQDVQFMELFTVYGLYLSDFSVMNPLEVETIVLIAIMCTGLRGPSLWHVRGLGRLLGARGTDESTQKMARIKDCLRGVKLAGMSVVEFVDAVSDPDMDVGCDFIRRARLEKWPNVGDVGRELGGWGDDG